MFLVLPFHKKMYYSSLNIELDYGFNYPFMKQTRFLTALKEAFENIAERENQHFSFSNNVFTQRNTILFVEANLIAICHYFQFGQVQIFQVLSGFNSLLDNKVLDWIK